MGSTGERERGRWRPGPNRNSLRLDLTESIEAICTTLKAQIASPLTSFNDALNRLIESSRAVLEQPPGIRTDAVWTDVDSTAAHLQKELVGDDAVRASWDDLVAASKDRTLVRREYRPIAELLFDQLERRGMPAEQAARDLISIVAFGRDPDDIPIGARDTPLDDRLSKARTLVGTPVEAQPTVVWLGYKGRINVHLTAGRVSFYLAQWAIPTLSRAASSSTTKRNSGRWCNTATPSAYRSEWTKKTTSTPLCASTSASPRGREPWSEPLKWLR